MLVGGPAVGVADGVDVATIVEEAVAVTVCVEVGDGEGVSVDGLSVGDAVGVRVGGGLV